MQLFTPIVINKNTGIRYEKLTAEKAIIFGNRQEKKKHKFFFETTANGITEQITFQQLKEMNS